MSLSRRCGAVPGPPGAKCQAPQPEDQQRHRGQQRRGHARVRGAGHQGTRAWAETQRQSQEWYVSPSSASAEAQGQVQAWGGLAADAGCRGVCAQRLRPPSVGTQLQGRSDPLIEWDTEAQGVSVHLPRAELTPGQPSCSRQNPETGAKSRGCHGPLGGHHTWDDSDVRVAHPGPRAGSVQAQHLVTAEEAAGPAQKPGFWAREAPCSPDLT